MKYSYKMVRVFDREVYRGPDVALWRERERGLARGGEVALLASHRAHPVAVVPARVTVSIIYSPFLTHSPPPNADFTEVMRALGYPRLISVENFRNPNFELVADVLYWMVKRYDPDISVHGDIESEDDRVEFLTSIAQNMLSKASIKLNTKKLYSADGHAVKELLKVATTLYHASRYSGEVDDGDDEDVSSAPITTRLSDVKAARSLASEITERGAKLHDLLKAEMGVRHIRQKAIRFLDAISGNLESGSEHAYIEKALNNIIEESKENVESMKRQVNEYDADASGLADKIKKRLASLQHVRPAFMDEYEKLERELQKQYEVYLEK